MESIRILHASDLHIAKIANLKSLVEFRSFPSFFRSLRYRNWANSYDPSVLRAFADFVSTAPAIDAILFTGDIATTGDYDDLATAFRFFEAHDSGPWFYGSVKAFNDPTLADVQLPIWLLPGNHDRFNKIGPKVFVPGGKEFHNVFGSYWGEDVKVYPQLTRRRGWGLVSVIAADFSLRSPADSGRWPNRYGRGRVYGDILAKLEAETIQLHDVAPPGLTILWAIHFPPDYPKLPEYMRLMDSDSIIEAANRCGVRAIMSGHTHERRRYKTQAMNFEVLCAGTASEHDPGAKHHFQIVNISDESEIRLEHYEFDRMLGGFRLAGYE